MANVNSDVKVIQLKDKIDVGGTNILTLKGQNCSKRAFLLSDRMRDMLQSDLSEADFKIVKTDKNDLTITVKDKIFVTVTKDDALINKCSKDFLAKKWLEKISKSYKELKILLPDEGESK